MDSGTAQQASSPGIRRKAIEGTGWLFLVSGSERAGTFLVTVVLARLLSPEEFGLVAIAWLVVNTAVLFADFGVGQAIIHSKEDKERLAGGAFLLSAGTGVLLYALAFVFAPSIAGFFGQPEVTNLVRVLGLLLIIIGVQRLPSAFLDRKLQFKSRVLPEVVSLAVYVGLSVGLAFAGAGFWSLVIGRLVGVALATVLYWVLEPIPLRFRAGRDVLRALSSYGKYIFGFTAARFVFSNLDNAVIGRTLGASALGLYSNAFTLALLPAMQVTQLIGRVMFPAYVKMDRASSQQEVYLQNVKATTLLAVPFSLALLMFAPGLIRVVYGDRWLGAAPALRVLALYGLFRSLGGVCTPLLMARDRQRVMFVVGALQALAVLAAAYPVARHWHLLGVAVLFTVAEGLSTVALVVVAAVALGGGWRCYARAASPSLIAAVLAFVGLGSVLLKIGSGAGSMGAVVSEVAAACLAYAGLVLLCDQDVRTATYALIRRWRSPSSGDVRGV